MIGWYKLFGTSSLVAVPPGGGKGDPALPVLPPAPAPTNPTPPPPPEPDKTKHWPHSSSSFFRLTHTKTIIFHISIAFLVHHSRLRIPRAGTNGSKKDFGRQQPRQRWQPAGKVHLYQTLYFYWSIHITTLTLTFTVNATHCSKLNKCHKLWPRPLSLSQWSAVLFQA